MKEAQRNIQRKMKKFLLWTLLFCMAGASSCDLLEKENDQGDDGPITTPDDRPFLSIELERLRTLVLPDDEVRIGFTVRTGNIPEQTEEEPLDIVYEAWTSDESVYEAEVLTEGDRAGALVVRGIGDALRGGGRGAVAEHKLGSGRHEERQQGHGGAWSPRSEAASVG